MGKIAKFYKVGSWIYLAVMLSLVYYYSFIEPIETNLTQTKFIIAYILANISILISAIGLFLYSLNKRKFMIFWKLYTLFYTYIVVDVLIDSFKTGGTYISFPFLAIALVGLWMYSFTNK